MHGATIKIFSRVDKLPNNLHKGVSKLSIAYLLYFYYLFKAQWLLYVPPLLVGRIAQSLRAERSEDPIPVEGKFSALVQTGPGAHAAFYTMGTESSLGIEWPGRGADHPPLSSAQVKERVELYLYFPSGPSWPVLRSTLPLTYRSF